LIVKSPEARLFGPAGVVFAAVLFIAFSCYGFPAKGLSSPGKPIILVLHTLKAKQPWTLLFNRYLAEELEQSTLTSYKLEIECLDLLEFNNKDHKEILKKLLHHKYEKLAPDIVIVTFDQALRFVQENNLFSDAPKIIVLPSRSGLTTLANSIMLPFAYDFKGNIEHSLNLLPDTKDIYVVAGNAAFDKRTVAKFKDDTREISRRVSFHYLAGLGVDELLARVKNLPPHALVYYLSYTLDSHGETIVARDFSKLLGQNANRPVFTYFDLFALNIHILGGRTTTTRASAVSSVNIVEQLVQGQQIESIAVPKPFFEYIYDWNELQKWGIDEAKLPAGSLVQNRTTSVFERYRRRIIFGFFLVIVESFLVLYMLLSITRRKKAEEEARLSKNRLEKVLETLPVGVWFTDSNGKIVYGNPAGHKIWQGARYVERAAFHEYKAWWHDTGKPVSPDEWAISRAIKKKEESREEVLDIECFDGVQKVILNWAAPIMDEEENVSGAVAVNQDITKRTQMDEQLAVQKKILDRSQEISHLGSWHLDIKKNVLTWSDEQYRIFGRTPQEFGATYEAFLETIHPDDREMVNKIYTNAIKNNEPYECVHRIVRNDGKVRIVLEKSEDIIDENGETIHSFGFTQDITERRLAEQEREKLIVELQKSLDEINTLRGILPICSFCKNIRNDEGYYEQIENYIHKHSGVDFSHTICPKCLSEHYPEINDTKR